MAKVLTRPARPQVDRYRRLNRGKTTRAQGSTSMAHQAPANRSRYGAVADATGETFEPDRSDLAASHLRLVWPQWQGAGTESIRSLAPEFARRRPSCWSSCAPR